MPRQPKTKVEKPSAPAPGLDELEDEFGEGLDESAMKELEAALETGGAPSGKASGGSSKPAKSTSTKKTKAPVEELEEDGGFGGLEEDEPDSSQVQTPDFGSGALAGVSARIDSLVENMSDNHNSLSNRIDSLQHTLKAALELFQVRMDEVLDLVKDLSNRIVVSEEDEENEEDEEEALPRPSDIDAVAGYTGVAKAKLTVIYQKARAIKTSVAGPKFVAWLLGNGLNDEQVEKLCQVFQIDASSKVTGAMFA